MISKGMPDPCTGTRGLGGGPLAEFCVLGRQDQRFDSAEIHAPPRYAYLAGRLELGQLEENLDACSLLRAGAAQSAGQQVVTRQDQRRGVPKCGSASGRSCLRCGAASTVLGEAWGVAQEKASERSAPVVASGLARGAEWLEVPCAVRSATSPRPIFRPSAGYRPPHPGSAVGPGIQTRRSPEIFCAVGEVAQSTLQSFGGQPHPVIDDQQYHVAVDGDRNLDLARLTKTDQPTAKLF